MDLTPRVNALGLVASDLARTVAFYRALGCDLPDPTAADTGLAAHLECDLGGVRLMIDAEEVLLTFTTATWSGAGRLSLAAECASPGEVDGVHVDLYAALVVV